MRDDRPGEDHDKMSCHSDYVDPEVARRMHSERLTQINTAPAHNVPAHDSVI